MKTTEQFSTKVNYVSPGIKVVALRTRRSILTVSGDSLLYGGQNSAGNEMEDDENYSYTF